jgi:AraC-like DNA-binding protein
MYCMQHVDQDSGAATRTSFAVAATVPASLPGGQASLHEPRYRLQQQVQEYIAARLNQSDLSPADIVQAFPMSRPTLYRMFAAAGGLATYIRTCRLHEAAVMLAQSPTCVIIDIAYGVGFSSASDFSRAFRRSYGMAPRAYREDSLRAQHSATKSTGVRPMLSLATSFESA